MLTEEMLTTQSGLEGLTTEQRQIIATLSRNDENAVIGARFGEVYRQMDETIKEATGIDRDGAEKTYNYLRRAANAFAAKYSDYDNIKSQVAKLTSEKAALEDKIAKGSTDAEVKAQLDAVKLELQTTKNQYNELKAEKDRAEVEHAANLLEFRVDAEMSRAKEGLKFKAGLNDAVIDTLLNQAITKVKANSHKFEGEAGKEVLHFFDANGVIMNNPDNKLNPYTAKELLVKELKTLDILDASPRRGAGGKGDVDRTGVSTYINAATQVEAMDAISKELMSRGFVKGTPKYESEVKKIWEENKISSLPLQ